MVSQVRAAAVLLAVVFGVACGPPKTTMVYGRLVDGSGNTPSAAGKVTVGDKHVDTNESGFFTISVTADVEVKLQATVTGYAPTVKVLTAPSQASTFVQITLLAWDASKPFDVAAGGVVSTGGTSVTFPPNAFDATGTVTAHLAWLDATDSARRAAFPGGFVTSDGKQLESFGAVAVVVEDSTGKALQLKSGQSAAMQLRVSSTPIDAVPLWYFDETSARWKQEGTLSQCTSGTCTASLPHLSWWNADQVYETACLKVCAKNSAGGAAAGVSLEARGTDYSGVTYATTAADGCACMNVKRNSHVEIVGVTSGGVIGPVVESTSSSTLTCSGGGCPQAAPLTIETPKFQAILTWNQDPRDLDSHLTGPCPASASSCTGRFHMYYSNRGSLTEAPFAYLDTDDTNGFGPEITTLTRCTAGVYRFSVHLFAGDPGLEASNAKVSLFLTDGTLSERPVPTENPAQDRVWVVGDLTCNDACSCTWAAKDTFGPDTDATYNP